MVDDTRDLSEQRTLLLGVLDAWIDRVAAEDADDAHASRPRVRLGPMVEAAGFERWSEVAAAVGCSPQYLMRLKRGVDGATDDTIRRLSHALLVPPELALIALRRPWTGWKW